MKKKDSASQKNNEKFEGIRHEIDSLEKDIEQIQESIDQYKRELQNHQMIYQTELQKEEEMNNAVQSLSNKMK